MRVFPVGRLASSHNEAIARGHGVYGSDARPETSSLTQLFQRPPGLFRDRGRRNRVIHRCERAFKREERRARAMTKFPKMESSTIKIEAAAATAARHGADASRYAATTQRTGKGRFQISNQLAIITIIIVSKRTTSNLEPKHENRVISHHQHSRPGSVGRLFSFRFRARVPIRDTSSIPVPGPGLEIGAWVAFEGAWGGGVWMA